MIQRMAKVEILGLKDVALEAIDAIHELGTLHIEDLSEKIPKMGGKRISRMEIDPKYADQVATLNTLRSKVGDMIRDLQLAVQEIPKAEVQKEYDAIWSEDVDVMIGRIKKIIDEVEQEVKDPLDRKADLMMELSRLETYAPIMQKIQPLAERVSKIEDMASIALVIERKFKAILNYLNDEISKITEGECEIISADVDEESTAALIVFNRRFLKQVHDFLAVQDVNQVRLPSDLAKKPLEEALTEIRARIKQIPEELEKIEEHLSEATKKYAIKLIAARNAIHDRIEAIEAVPKFAQTDQVFIISGWLPEECFEELEKVMLEKFGNKVVVTVTDIREEEELEETPVALKNRPFVRYFEIIYLLSKYPKYGTVDPTVVFAIFFPIFFGIMVGDIGYGIIITALGYFVFKKFRNKPLLSMGGYVLTVSGAWTIFFGILYFEVFGDLLEKALHHWGVHLPLLGSEHSFISFPINRLEAFTLMMLVSCALGFIHIGVGLVIGMINGYREGNKKHILEKAGGLTFLIGLLVAGLGLAKYIPKFFGPIGIVFALVGVVMATAGAGMGGLIETIVSAGNVLSYARLIAVGLASVILAQVTNDLTRQLWHGVFGVIVGIVVAILLHTLAVVIAMFSPSIHALRLNLVESFNKFFEPAKFRYEPFRKTGGEE